MESLAHRAAGHPRSRDDEQRAAELPNFIGGRWQESRGGGTDPVLDPATGEVIAEVASSNAADVDSAVAAAAEAFAGWAATAPGQRAAALQQLADRLEEHADDLVAIESRNVGKPIAAVPDRGRLPGRQPALLRRRCARASRPRRRASTSAATRRSCGASRSAWSASIAPWNYPMMMAGWKIGPALAAGNTVVLKPSELTPAHRAEAWPSWPPTSSRRACFNVITGDGEHCGAALVAHPNVRDRLAHR